MEIEIPSMAFGVDIQNYGSDAQLIYMLDGDDIHPFLKDEQLITRDLGKGNFKVDRIDKQQYKQVVHLIKIF